MADLSLTAADMVDRIEVLRGWSSPSSPQSVLALSWLNDGYRRFLRGEHVPDPRTGIIVCHTWNFLRPKATLVVWPTLTTAVVTVSGAGLVLTAATASFYPSMLGRTIVGGTTGVSYTVSSYTSSTVIGVAATAAADTGATFTFTATGQYALPTDFGGLIGQPVWANDGTSLPDLVEIDPAGMDAKLRDDSDAATPERWCIVPRSITSTPQRWDMLLWPIPDAVRTMNYRYRVQADALTDSSAVYAVGGVDYCDVILQAGKAESERATSIIGGPEEALYNRMMQAAVGLDSTSYGAGDAPEQLTDADNGM